jgi:transcriptional regulator with XRE-family HTH domain
MLDQFTTLEDGELGLPTSSLDLSMRMRDLRARQGLKQSEVARRMGLDPSIPSLWEQGKRLVPANRVRPLAEALEVSVEELLEGITGATRASKPAADGGARAAGVAELVDERAAARQRITETGPLLRLLPRPEDAPPTATLGSDTPPEPWVVPQRPPLDGYIPDGWQPNDRIQDISPSLPDGYWLDPIKLERQTARQLLHSRLCPIDREIVDGQDVPGAALAERIFAHCSKDNAFVPGRLPLAETIFRCVLSADHGGLTDGALVEMLRERAGAVPVSATLLRRMRDSVKPYPIRRVDAELFGGRR